MPNAFPPIPVQFSKEERDQVERVAKLRGLTFDEAANLLANGGIEHGVKKRTGHRPAKIYSLPKRRTNAPEK